MAGKSLNTGTSEQPLPNPNNNATTETPTRHGSTSRAQKPDEHAPLTQTGFDRGAVLRAPIGSSVRVAIGLDTLVACGRERVGLGLYVADGDGGCVAAGLVGRGVEITQQRVRGVL